MSRSYTPDELVDMVMQAARTVGAQAATDHPNDSAQAVDQAIHSIFCILDGVSGGVPFASTLVAECHPDDAAHHQLIGEDWVPAGTPLNESLMLHDEWARIGGLQWLTQPMRAS